MDQTPQKILLIRLDKIGDLVCTMPVDEVLDPKKWDVTWVIQKGLSVIPNHSQPIRKFIELDKNNPDEARNTLRNWISQNKPKAAISFNAPWWVNFELWHGKIPWRGGVKSQWHSFVFLNHARRQKRSQAVMHEADYNMDLLSDLVKLPPKTPILSLVATAKEKTELTAKYPILSSPFVIVHPGMMGSARNWPTEKYVDLIVDLSKNTNVLMTGTNSDNPYVLPVIEGLKNKNLITAPITTSTQFERPLVYDARNLFSLTEMLSVIALAKHVYAPSTGIIHLAASIGTPCTGFFSGAIKVHHPRRWGPRGTNVTVLLPKDEAPEK